jgi:putative sterol carrier protein
MENQLGAAMRHGLFPDAGSPPLVWDEDAADAFLIALKSGTRGAFNLVAEQPLPAPELARELGMRLLPRAPVRAIERAVSALRILPPLDPGWFRATGFPLVYSSEKAKRELGWKPRCPTARDVIRKYAATVPRTLDRRIAIWARVVDSASRSQPPRAELKGYDATVHLDLTGRNGGDFTLRVADGRVRLRRGAPRPANAVATMTAATLLDLLAGRTDIAAAQLTGKVRIEGQGHAALVVAGLVAAVRGAGKQPGWRGWSARKLARWMAA